MAVANLPHERSRGAKEKGPDMPCPFRFNVNGASR
jgi:hypothetical protein